jgi:hypothetical protein
MSATTATLINGRTADEWEAVAVAAEQAAQRSSAASRESFERSDTDGFLSQWASDSMAREYHARAAWARDHGYATISVLLLADGTLASTMIRDGQYGSYWVLNDTAAAVIGKRFFNTSKARDYRKQHANNLRKGIKVAQARVPASAPKLRGSNALALSVYAEPEWDRVKAGEIEIVDTEWLLTLADQHDAREARWAEREANRPTDEPMF